MPLPLEAAKSYSRTHWIRSDYYKHFHKHLSVEEAKSYALSVNKWSLENRVDADIISSIITTETHWDKQAIDKNGGGITELQVDTAQMVANELGLEITITIQYLQDNPDVCIRLACRHYRDLLDQFNNDSMWAIKAYNVGAGAAKRSSLYGFSYLQAVLAVYKKYELFKRE